MVDNRTPWEELLQDLITTDTNNTEITDDSQVRPGCGTDFGYTNLQNGQNYTCGSYS